MSHVLIYQLIKGANKYVAGQAVAEPRNEEGIQDPGSNFKARNFTKLPFFVTAGGSYN